MKPKIIILTLIFLLAINLSMQGQAAGNCKDFALKMQTEQFANTGYISDGRYYAKKLRNGDKAQLYKPLFRGKQYRIIAVVDGNLEGVNMEVKDFRGSKLLFRNEKPDSLVIWDYIPQKSSNFIITVSVPKNQEIRTIKSGCVAIFVGFKNPKQ